MFPDRTLRRKSIPTQHWSWKKDNVMTSLSVTSFSLATQSPSHNLAFQNPMPLTLGVTPCTVQLALLNENSGRKHDYIIRGPEGIGNDWYQFSKPVELCASRWPGPVVSHTAVLSVLMVHLFSSICHKVEQVHNTPWTFLTGFLNYGSLPSPRTWALSRY